MSGEIEQMDLAEFDTSEPKGLSLTSAMYTLPSISTYSGPWPVAYRYVMPMSIFQVRFCLEKSSNPTHKVHSTTRSSVRTTT